MSFLDLFKMDKIKAEKMEMLNSVYKWQKGDAEYPTAPVHMQIELSNVCNINCLMCSFFSPLVQRDKINQFENAGLMPIDLVDKLDSFLRKTLYLSLFGYGEPLVHPQFEQIIKKMSKYKLCTTFYTNATNLNDKIAQILVDNNVYKITISFSGARKEIYENIYLGSNFEDVISKIKYLSEYKKLKKKKYPLIELNSIGFKDHVNEFDRFVEIMGEVGVNSINLMPLNDYLSDNTVLQDNICIVRPEIEGVILNRAKAIAKKYNMIIGDTLSDRYTAHNEEEYRKFLNILSSKKAVNAINLKLCDAKSYCAVQMKELGHRERRIVSTECFSQDLSSDEIYKELNPAKFDTTFKCTQPFTMMYVTQDGHVKPCCNMGLDNENGTTKTLGDLNINSCDEIWNNKPYKIFRNVINEGKYPYVGCKFCVDTVSYPPEDNYIYVIKIYANWYKDSFQDKSFNKIVKKLKKTRR